VVLYRLLSGHCVFRGKTLKEIAEQHVLAPIPPLNMWRSGLPAQLDSVIARAMAKEPTERFSQPGALANAYAEVVAPNDTKRTSFVIATPGQAALSTGVERRHLGEGTRSGG